MDGGGKQQERWGLTRHPSPPRPHSPRSSLGVVGSPLLQQAAEVQLARIFRLPFAPVAVERGYELHRGPVTPDLPRIPNCSPRLIPLPLTQGPGALTIA